MTNTTRCAILSVIFLGLPTTAWSATVAIPASRDNTIYQSAPNNSAGGAAGIFVGTNAAASPRRGLIAFDVAAQVPAGSTITEAFLSLYMGNAATLMPLRTIGLHRLNVDWGEGVAGNSSPSIGGGGNGFAAAAGDATWNERFFGSSPWTGPGGTGDFNPIASATATAGETLDTPFFWLSTPSLVNDVQGWLNHPSSNFGWALVNTNETTGQTVRVFYSSEATLNSAGAPLDPTWRPTLTVTYVIPEPSALMMLILAPPFAFAYRRR